MAKTVNPAWEQTGFRYRNDDGSESGASWIANLNVIPTSGDVAVDTIFRLRVQVSETAGTTESPTFVGKLQYNLNSGGWNDVGASTPVQYAASADTSWTITDGDATTEQFAGSNTFHAGSMEENATWASVTGIGIAGDGGQPEDIEIEAVLYIDSAQVSNGQTLEFRVVHGSGSEQTEGTTLTETQAIGQYTISEQQDATATPTAISATATIPTPTVAGNVDVSATAVAATTTIGTVSVSGGATVTATAVAATATVSPVQIDPDLRPFVWAATADVSELFFEYHVGEFAATFNRGLVVIDSPMFTPASGGVNVSATAVAVTATVGTVSVSGGATATPSAVVATATIPTPTASGGATVSATAIAAISSIPTPGVSGGATVSATAVVVTKVISTPSVSGGATVTTSAVVATTTIPTPTLSSAVNVAATALLATATVGTVSVSVGITVSATALVATATVPTPSVTTGSNVDISATALVATATIPTPTASGGATVSATAVAATATIPTPTVAGNVDISASALVATTTIPTPSVSGSVDVAATAHAATTTIPTPTVSGGATVTATALVATGTIPTPTVTTGGAPSVSVDRDERPFAWASTGSTEAFIFDAAFTVTVRGLIPYENSVNVQAAAVVVTASIPTPAVYGAEDERPFVWAATGSAADTIYDYSARFALVDGILFPLSDRHVNVLATAVVVTAHIPGPDIGADVGETDPFPLLWKLSGEHQLFYREQTVGISGELGPVPFTRPPSSNVNINVQAVPVVATAYIPTPTTSAGALVSPSTVVATATIPEPISTGGIGAVALVVTATIPTPEVNIGAHPAAVPVSAHIPSPSLQTGGNVWTTPHPVLFVAYIPTPTVGAGADPGPSSVVFTAHIPTPTVHVGNVSATATPSSVVFTAFIPTPTLPLELADQPGDTDDRGRWATSRDRGKTGSTSDRGKRGSTSDRGKRGYTD